MNSQYYPQGRSPPPLQHPIPTHAHYQIPEPPGTPHNAEPGYMRFTSPPVTQQQQQQHFVGAQPMYGQPPPPPQFGGGYGPTTPQQYQNFTAGPGPSGGPRPVPPAGNMNGWGVMNDTTAQMGMQLGRSAVAAGQEYVEKNFGAHLLPVSIFKHHFNVSNSFVLHKLRIILWPWRHKPWSRKPRRSETNGQNEGYQPPRDDINAPDLYIPSMAVVTYILTATWIVGVGGNFHPELLGITASKATAVMMLDVGFIKLGCYFMNIPGQGPIVDLIAFSGYKFVGTVVTLLSGILLGRKLYWLVFFYCFGANGFFLLRSLRYVVLPDPNASVGNSTVTHAQRGWRIKFLFIIAMLQVLYMAFLALL